MASYAAEEEAAKFDKHPDQVKARMRGETGTQMRMPGGATGYKPMQQRPSGIWAPDE